MKDEDMHLDELEFENKERVAYLIAGYIRKNLSPAESRELDDWVAASEEHVVLFERLTDEAHFSKTLGWQAALRPKEDREAIHKRIALPVQSRSQIFRLAAIGAAAAVLLVAGSLLFLPGKKPPLAKQSVIERVPDVPPGASRAQLVLADGSVIALDKAGNGQLAQQGSTRIVKTDSLLAYQPAAPLGDPASFNTLSTPRGGQFGLVLPDGTKVWLNAASSIRYPTAFGGNERKVELTGEAYFEVAKDASRPFEVTAAGVRIQVLGTHFNINAYGDETEVRTTLLEGSVQIRTGTAMRTLRPGEAADVNGTDIRVGAGDETGATSWRKGYLVFHNTPTTTILKELERWYDIEADNQGNNVHLTATISRHDSLSKVLHVLETTRQIHFRWTGKKLEAR